MPKTLIQCTQEWWLRWQDVHDEAIACCQGWTARIDNCLINGEYDAEDLLDQLEGEIRQLRKALEAVRVPF